MIKVNCNQNNDGNGSKSNTIKSVKSPKKVSQERNSSELDDLVDLLENLGHSLESTPKLEPKTKTKNIIKKEPLLLQTKKVQISPSSAEYDSCFESGYISSSTTAGGGQNQVNKINKIRNDRSIVSENSSLLNSPEASSGLETDIKSNHSNTSSKSNLSNHQKTSTPIAKNTNSNKISSRISTTLNPTCQILSLTSNSAQSASSSSSSSSSSESVNNPQNSQILTTENRNNPQQITQFSASSLSRFHSYRKTYERFSKNLQRFLLILIKVCPEDFLLYLQSNNNKNILFNLLNSINNDNNNSNNFNNTLEFNQNFTNSLSLENKIQNDFKNNLKKSICNRELKNSAKDTLIFKGWMYSYDKKNNLTLANPKVKVPISSIITSEMGEKLGLTRFSSFSSSSSNNNINVK